MEEPATEIGGRKRARRARWFFTYQIGGLIIVMVLLTIVAVSKISDGEYTGWWLALLVAEPLVLAGLIWHARAELLITRGIEHLVSGG